MLPGYDTYSIAACRLQCEKEAVVRSCHCRMVHMPGEGMHMMVWGHPTALTVLPRAAPALYSLHPKINTAPSLCTQG